MHKLTGRYLPKIHNLVALVAVAREKSFTEAAASLNLTQSAVSRQIKELEEFLGKPLLVRNPREVALTATGAAYVAALAPLLEQIDTATRLAMDDGGRSTKITVSSQSSFGVLWLMPRLEAFQKACPDIEIHVQTHLGEPDLSQPTADIYIVTSKKEQPGWHVDWLLQCGGYPVCSPRLLNDGCNGAEALRRLPLLNQRATPDTWRHYFERLQMGKVPAHQGPVYALLTMGLQAAISGMGISMLPEFVYEDALAAGNLVKVIDQRLNRNECYGLYIPSATMAETNIGLFRDWLLNEVENYLADNPCVRPRFNLEPRK